MKKRPLIVIHLFIISGLFVLLATGCKKTDDPETVTDLDGNVYKTVTIGTQTWLAENLKTTKLNDGTTIALETDNSAWASLYNLSSAGYCWYDNNAANGKIYGALYNYAAVSTGKLCPTGWHVPTGAEWQALRDNTGGENTAGGNLKEKGTAHWNSPNTEATDRYGFKALPSGERYEDGDFVYLGINNNFWSRLSKKDTEPLGVRMYHDSPVFHMSNFHRGRGLSVRCVKN